LILGYPLVNQHDHGKSLFSIGKSTINGNVQWQTVSLPEGMNPHKLGYNLYNSGIDHLPIKNDDFQ
jgi:hypothetical protein